MATPLNIFAGVRHGIVTRDLKHQDGRWRRGRQIRVKAEARPASRFTCLSMLSNIATATSRKFLEKIPPRKYL